VNSEHSDIDSDPLDPAAETRAKPEPKPKPGPGSEPEPKPRRGGSALAFLALLIALAAAAGTAWIWWQDQASGDSTSAQLLSEVSRLESNDGHLSAQLQELSKAIEALSAAGDTDTLNELKARSSEDRAQLEAMQQALQQQLALTRSQQEAADAMHGRLLAAEAALAAASGRELDARGELDTAEVDYLLRLANERLQLFSDPVAAERALVLADAHLAALDNPSYLGVRQAIAAARSDLAAVDLPDDLVIAGQLDAMQKAIPTLPFPEAILPTAGTVQEAEEGWWEKLKATFASLVTVRRSTGEENRRISLQDQDYVRQRLWLQLEVAHLALMRHDQDALSGALQRVRAVVDEWLDPASSEVEAFKASLSGLQSLDVEVAWPDISAPWTTLQLVRSARSAPAPAAPAAVMPQEQPTPASANAEPESEAAEYIPEEGH
jgi:uroporphyrin-3 C-methyltransferase